MDLVPSPLSTGDSSICSSRNGDFLSDSNNNWPDVFWVNLFFGVRFGFLLVEILLSDPLSSFESSCVSSFFSNSSNDW
ncbi:hypothetical protein TVAG_247950 [Trichomonas vaginalis G3]|uniref:Uncharacterized protein n=1 Tax=Trichomonas vaginalis (strain ATCC PRA-98 / G3) TaxID=412133 RepID=A2FRF0_TRIV3|nr:hypothetical protein TVAG_247950 [Trichomonas vaginalis G3]|eukprot:XP_001305444.1 hypothetical protein [Trichomonas vaginalis G3]